MQVSYLFPDICHSDDGALFQNISANLHFISETMECRWAIYFLIFALQLTGPVPSISINLHLISDTTPCRWAMYSLIFAKLLTGPVANILANLHLIPEPMTGPHLISDTMACLWAIYSLIFLPYCWRDLLPIFKPIFISYSTPWHASEIFIPWYLLFCLWDILPIFQPIFILYRTPWHAGELFIPWFLPTTDGPCCEFFNPSLSDIRHHDMYVNSFDLTTLYYRLHRRQCICNDQDSRL